MYAHIPFGKPLTRWHEADHFQAAMFYAERVSASEGAVDRIEDAMADGEPETPGGTDATPDALEYHRGLVRRNRWWAQFHLRAAEYLAQQ